MSAQELELIKDRQLFLKSGELSSEVVLVDTNGDGDMYFSFELKYVGETEKPQTNVQIKDNHHATLRIGTKPDSVTKPNAPIRIGSYGAERRPLYIGFVIEPRIGGNGEHRVSISFYVGKEVENANR